MMFRDRSDAGKQLARALSAYSEEADVLLLALPRGGVPVAYEVARELHLPLDLWLVRKLGIPGDEEVAMGALAMGDVIVFNEDILQHSAIPEAQVQAVIDREFAELQRRNEAYREGKPAPDVAGKRVILIDDGLATGATMRAAALALRRAKAKEIIVAVPVGTSSACQSLEEVADTIICLAIPKYFYGVGSAYASFPQNTDDEVRGYIEGASRF